MALDIVQAYNLTENCHLYAKAEPAFYNLIRNKQKLGPLKKHETIWKNLAVMWLLIYTKYKILNKDILWSVHVLWYFSKKVYTKWILIPNQSFSNTFSTFTKPLYPFLLQYYLVYLAYSSPIVCLSMVHLWFT